MVGVLNRPRRYSVYRPGLGFRPSRPFPCTVPVSFLYSLGVCLRQSDVTLPETAEAMRLGRYSIEHETLT